MTSERTDLEDRLDAIADELEADDEPTGFDFSVTWCDDVDGGYQATYSIGETEAEERS
jgi:hypothetical protein